MPIHDQGYRRYGGRRVRLGRGWAVIAAAGIRARLGRRALQALLVIAWVPFLARAMQLYAATNLPQMALLAPTPEMFRQQGIFVWVITIYCGAGLVANDRRANALQLYLSKPITRAEYILGKFAVLAAFLLLVTWLPASLLLVVQILFAGNFNFFADNLYLFPAITAFSLVQIVVVASAMLALSSLSRNSRYVGILYAALLFFSEALSGVLRVARGNTQLSWISVPADLIQIGDAIFRTPLSYDAPWPLSLVVLLLLVAASALVLARRVRGVEVVA
jgi:ABC-2 type transport system permease protein